MKNLFTILILYFLLTSQKVTAENEILEASDDKLVVIALAPFCEFQGGHNTGWYIMSLRDKVVANLLQNYNCIILSRNNGIMLSSEHKLNIMNQIEEDATDFFYLPRVDFAITGYFQRARRTHGENHKVDLSCTLLISDLNKEDEKNFKKLEFIPNEKDLYVDNVTQQIAKILKLKPRKKQYVQQNGKIDETWAVLPVKYIESEKAISSPPDWGLAIDLELALQKSGKLKHIVDHNDIDKVIQELKISNFNNATENAAGKIAKLIGADKIIMTTVSKQWKNEKDLRIDAFLIDAKTTVILDSLTRVIKPELLNSTVIELGLQFTKRKYQLPLLDKATSNQMIREVSIYKKMFFSLPSLMEADHRILVAISLAEIIYLLESENDIQMAKIGRSLFFNLLIYQGGSFKNRCKVAELVEHLLKPINYPEKLLYIARAFSHVPYRLDEAIALAERHIKNHPEDPSLAYSIIGYCYLHMKDYQKALEYAQKGKDNFFSYSVRIKTYWALNDSKYNEDELKALEHQNFKEAFSYEIYRRLKLTLEIKGPEAALEYEKKMSSYAKVRPEIILEKAKALLALNRKQQAGSLISGIAREKFLNNNYLKDDKLIDAFKKEVYSLNEKLNSSAIPWKTFAEVLDIPDKYKLYIVPMGNPNMELLKDSVPLIEEFLGCRVEFLNRLSMPDDPFCFKKERGQYHAYHVQQRLRVVIPPPEDAILIVGITEKDIYVSGLRFVYSAPLFGSSLISYNHWYGAGNNYVLSNMLAKSICSCLITNFKVWGCSRPLCINSSDGSAWGVRDTKFLLCPECSNKLKRNNINSMCQELYYQSSKRISCRHTDKQEWKNAYKKIVDKTLSEVKKKVAEERKKPIDYTSAVKLDSPILGLQYKYYEFLPSTCKSTIDLEKLTPNESGITDTFNFLKAKRDKNFGLEFCGYIKIPYDGKYQFYLSSDDGSRLYIDNKEIIDNDKMQESTTKSVKVALKAGYHKIKVSYLQGEGERLLTLYYRGAKTLGQKIPAEVLFHK